MHTDPFDSLSALLGANPRGNDDEPRTREERERRDAVRAGLRAVRWVALAAAAIAAIWVLYVSRAFAAG